MLPTGAQPEGRARRRPGAIATIVAGMAVLSACGGGNTNVTRSNDAVAAGLKAQAAGNLGAASSDYTKALSFNPMNKFALYDLGLLDQMAGRTASAESRYRAALALDPNLVPALFNLAIIRTVPAPQEAEALYQQVITLDSTRAQAYLNLGLLLKASGQTLLAAASLTKAVSLDPSLAQAAGLPSTGPTTTAPAAAPTTLPRKGSPISPTTIKRA